MHGLMNMHSDCSATSYSSIMPPMIEKVTGVTWLKKTYHAKSDDMTEEIIVEYYGVDRIVLHSFSLRESVPVGYVIPLMRGWTSNDIKDDYKMAVWKSPTDDSANQYYPWC